MPDNLTYEGSGVNIEANDQMVDKIYSSVSSTFGPRVMALKGGFAGMFRLDYDEKLFRKNYKEPVLVACTDGAGSKVQLASELKKYDTVGIDLVAMSVNDMLVQGAEPLFFLDYIAVHKLKPENIAEMVKGVADGCKYAGCALIGGETAEMPGTYKENDFDMAGFAVGVVERKKIIDGKNVKAGDVLLGLASSGVHSNGYSLVRNICFKKGGLKMTDMPPELDGKTLGDVLLEPTQIYVEPVIKLLAKYKTKSIVHAMAHITGGGLVGNIPRVLPANCSAVLNKDSWPVPNIFGFLQRRGPVAEDEMFKVFNMGIGFVLVVAEDFAKSVEAKLTDYGQKVYKIGRVIEGDQKIILK